jgi:butyryl-CoA dehydrogenase
VAISNAMQVMGGYGYAREYPIEQLYRDNRLNQIHEGTNGIQALDLLGRKVVQNGGACFKALATRMRGTISECAEGDKTLQGMAANLSAALGQWAECTQVLGIAMAKDPTRALANATVYYEVSARVVVAWLWLRMARVAAARLVEAQGEGEQDFLHGKLHAARYWFVWELPRIAPDIALLKRLDSVTLDALPAWF